MFDDEQKVTSNAQDDLDSVMTYFNLKIKQFQGSAVIRSPYSKANLL